MKRIVNYIRTLFCKHSVTTKELFSLGSPMPYENSGDVFSPTRILIKCKKCGKLLDYYEAAW